VVGAALLLVAAFFTKQTASPFMLGLGLVLLVVSFRAALLYGATLAVVGLPLLYWMNRATDGWFWTYTSKLHRLHDFYPLRAFVGSPLRLLLLLGPAVLLVPWALLRRRSPELVFASVLAVLGIGAACVGFGTQWAFTNAFIPGVFFPAIAIATAAGRLTHEDSSTRPPRLRPMFVYLLLLSSLFCSTGYFLPLARARLSFAKTIGLPDDEPTELALRRFIPTPQDRAQGDELMQRLRAMPGEVLVPFHPFYAHLAGKRAYLHRMGVMDVGRAGFGTPRGLKEAIAEKRFSLIVMDDKLDGNAWQWPGLGANYRLVGHVPGPKVVSGAQTRPRDLYEPVVAPDAPPAQP
jgi:hypothetical protein